MFRDLFRRWTLRKPSNSLIDLCAAIRTGLADGDYLNPAELLVIQAKFEGALAQYTDKDMEREEREAVLAAVVGAATRLYAALPPAVEGFLRFQLVLPTAPAEGMTTDELLASPIYDERLQALFDAHAPASSKWRLYPCELHGTHSRRTQWPSATVIWLNRPEQVERPFRNGCGKSLIMLYWTI